MSGESVYNQVLSQHRQTLDRIIERGSVDRLRRVYDRAANELLRKLENVGGRGTFTDMQQRRMLAQLMAGQIHMSDEMTDTLASSTREAQVDSLHSLVRGYKKLEKHFTGLTPTLPIEEMARFSGVIDKRRASLLQQHRSSMRNYGKALVTDIREELAVSLGMGENFDATIKRVQKTMGGEWWQAERICRTETAWASSVAHIDGIVEVAKDDPEIMQQWIEFCGPDGRPLDDRVGVDSIAMHGQVTKPGGVFTMPATAPYPDAKGNTKVSDSLVGKSWAAPPCRPNGRETVAPWRKDWGTPGWEYRDGRRHWLVRP